MASESLHPQRTSNYFSGKPVYVLTIYLNLWNFLQQYCYCHRSALVKLNILSITKKKKKKLPGIFPGKNPINNATHLTLLSPGKWGNEVQEYYIQDIAVCEMSRKLKIFTKEFGNVFLPCI